MTAITIADRAASALMVMDLLVPDMDPRCRADLMASVTATMTLMLHLAEAAGMNHDEVIDTARGHYAREIVRDPAGELPQSVAARLAAMKEAA